MSHNRGPPGDASEFWVRSCGVMVYEKHMAKTPSACCVRNVFQVSLCLQCRRLRHAQVLGSTRLQVRCAAFLTRPSKRAPPVLICGTCVSITRTPFKEATLPGLLCASVVLRNTTFSSVPVCTQSLCTFRVATSTCSRTYSQ